ncbi:Flp family type IVb pilin [Terrihabitans rhizophilus]|uniref:Flp family type IVb pilin n=1 Tax=Terrihabitans rhizophilus TaxID=3092662 RepID=A0ABU4RI54_9HYPH|nr:Flp family type IVb pilin [Terrihabitans sp. PJ23]MDX6804512.1 Flp family type IVb pilin [Terrihabitans sp. PJ23]
MTLFSRFKKNESGATAIEYALIAAIVGIGLIAIMGTLVGNLETGFGNLGGQIANVPAPGGTGGTGGTNQ